MTLSETGKWLEHALRTLSSDGDSVLQLDPDTLYTLVSYCESAPPADASEYLLNIVGDARCKDIVAEYLRKRGGTEGASDVGMQPYQKPPQEEYLSTGIKKTPKQKSGAVEGPGNASTQKDPDHKSSPLYSGNGVFSAENIVQKGKSVGKAKKGVKGKSLAEASKGLVMFTRSGPCDCQCTRHKLVNNCLSCGRIVCEQEGEGPCLFCGVLVLREGSDYGGLEGLPVPPATKSEALAEEFKNRLVECDRTAASRTTVIDDQSDYFEIEGNTWLTEKEKKLLQERLTDEEQKEDGRRKHVNVTIDLLGRKVILAGQEDGKEAGEKLSMLGREVFVSQHPPKVHRIKPNPYLQEAPMFIGTRQSTATATFGPSDTIKPSLGKTQLLKSCRIQHDDPIVEALIGHSLNDSGSREEKNLHVWQSPKTRAGGQREEEEKFFYCEAPMAALQDPLRTRPNTSTSQRSNPKETSNHTTNSATREPIIDICLSVGDGKSKAVALAPSMLALKQTKRKEALSESNRKSNQPNTVLLPGTVLLKRWLSPEQQVEIVNYCRTLGIGPGGFYQPAYEPGAKMHLQMMCLGMQWEPGTKSYGPRRSHHDNALPPSIPDYLTRLVEEALSVARVTAAQDSGVMWKLNKSSSHVPEMVPNVCIVNFYQQRGNLGMHQDKDESVESLQKQRPVVSFSIGDSAEFLYGQQPDELNSDKVVLESGDVLIFGGPSRMIYHGITRVISDTCPKWLSQKTNLSPGRLNLTFRQF